MNDSVVLAALKALSNETKALIIVSEMGARRMPSFQLRTIFNAMLKDEDERRIIVDLIDKELHASGCPEEQIAGLLNDLLTPPNAFQQMNDSVQSTRRMRSPFAHNFESQMPAQVGAGLEPPPNTAPIIGAVQYNPRSNFAAAPADTQRSGNSQVFKRPAAAANPEEFAPTRTGAFPSALPQGLPSRLSPPRDSQPRPEGGQQTDARNGPAAAPAPAAARYSQNAFSSVDEALTQMPPKPAGFNKNSYTADEKTVPAQAPGLPGFPGMPPVTVRPPQYTPGGNPTQNLAGLSAAPTQRRFAPDNRLSPAAAASAVSEAALLTPGLANFNGPMASKIASRNDGSPNNFQGGNSTIAARNEGRPVILIADDDKRIRMVFRLRMEESGLSVVECADGTEAWERIQQGDIDLAVLDMKMPGLHGLEVLSRMADKQFRIPVIVCSAYDQLKDEFVVQTYPRLRYLVKPVAPEQLVGSIKELLVKQPA